ncbi:MAG: DUF4112 domain-containing protein [Pseudomonadales bacterium]|nr:DUF4112 domain-containing protein [Pseudomonadales bacterium]
MTIDSGKDGSKGSSKGNNKGVDKANISEAPQRLVNITQQKQQLARLSILLDEAFTLPVIGVRVGWDAIIGLIPVIGDGAGAIISSYFVYKALRFKMPLTTVVKMLLNIGIELLIGIVPLVGDVLDVAWKANRRNYRLMEGFFEEQERDLADVCRQQGLSALAVTEPERRISQKQDSRGHLVMLLVFVLIICSILANRGPLESLVSSLEHGVGVGVESEAEVDVSAEIEAPVPTQLETVTSDRQP